MRRKEDAHDYRYFPDPDLPPLAIAPEWVERVKGEMPELPGAMAARFERDDGLSAYDASMMTQSLAFARYYEATKAAGAPAKPVANWLMGEVSKRLNAEGCDIDASPVAPATLAALIGRVVDGTVSNNGARQVFDALWGGIGVDVDTLIAAKGLKQLNDTGALEKIDAEVIAANAKSVDEYRAGKDKAFNALVGQVMKASKGQANPAISRAPHPRIALLGGTARRGRRWDRGLRDQTRACSAYWCKAMGSWRAARSPALAERRR